MDNKPTQDEVNSYLDAIRESGQINMFGAAPYVADMFNVSRSEARKYLQVWMETFSQRHVN